MWLWALRNKKVTTKNIIFFFSFLLFSLTKKLNLIPNGDHRTALHHAALNAQNDVWEELIKRGAAEDAEDKYKNIPAAYR